MFKKQSLFNNVKSLTVWSLITVAEWNLLKSTGILEYSKEHQQLECGDEWILSQLYNNNYHADNFHELPFSGYLFPRHYSIMALNHQNKCVKNNPENKLILIRYRIYRTDVVILHDSMDVALRSNWYISSSLEEDQLMDIKYFSNTLPNDVLPKHVQELINKSRERLLTSDHIYADFPGGFVHVYSKCIFLSQLISAIQIHTGDFKYPDCITKHDDIT